MLTSRSLARCLVLLSVNALLLSGADARAALRFDDFAPALSSPQPSFAVRAIGFPPFGGGNQPTSESNTAAVTTGVGTATTGGTPTPTDSKTTAPAQTPTDSATTPTPSATSDTTKATDPATSNTAPVTTPTTPTAPVTSPTPSQTEATPTPTLTPSKTIETVNSNGETTTITQYASGPATGSATATTGSDQNSSDTNDKPSGISTSTIIGLSVSGGVALIGLIAFIVWKVTRKRFSDDDFDNEAIKWPELNAHGDDGVRAPLPTNRTGGAGFETSSQVNLAVPARPDSRAGSVAPSAGSSVDLYPNQDPYAVPPLPHLNPNMPYRDDPNGVYYDNDPYAPVAAPVQGEVIPMTQIGRSRSPGPQMAYGYDPRAMSPAPQQALGVDYRARSPGPAASLYAAPGPQAGRMSPGPQAAYGPGPGY